MFNVACKDPFDAEKVGERRARKWKESSEAIDHMNDALSNFSLSAKTRTTGASVSGAFSTTSSRSSRTSIIGTTSFRSESGQRHSAGYDGGRVQTPPASVRYENSLGHCLITVVDLCMM